MVKLDDAEKLLKLIPALVIVIAITYEIGYFSGFDASLFSLFSISDHILFTLEATPVALIVIPLGAFLAIVFDMILEFYGLSGADIDKEKLDKASKIIFASGIIVFGLQIALKAQDVSILIGFYLMVFGLVFSPKVYERMPNLIPPLGVGLCLSFAFYFGLHLSSERRDSTKQGPQTHKISVDGKVISGRMITSGERGIIFYDADTKNVVYYRREHVDSITSIPTNQ